MPEQSCEPRPHVVERHIECAKCGYDLRGLTVEGLCPECGDPVITSLNGRWLRYADREWVGRIVRGLRLEEACRKQVLLSIVGVIGILVILATLPAISVPLTLERTIEKVLSWIVGMWTVVSLFGMSLGMWRAAEPEPHVDDESALMNVAFRASHLTVVPAFGLWLAFARPAPFQTVQELIAMHACFAVITANLEAMAHLANRIEARCLGGTGRPKIPSKPSRAVIAAIVLLAICWIRPLSLLDGGAWSPPDRDAGRLLYFAMAITWFIMASRFRLTLDSVQIELGMPAKFSRLGSRS